MAAPKVCDYGDRIVAYTDDSPDATVLAEAVKGRPACGWSVRWTDTRSHWELADRKPQARRLVVEVATRLLAERQVAS